MANLDFSAYIPVERIENAPFVTLNTPFSLFWAFSFVMLITAHLLQSLLENFSWPDFSAAVLFLRAYTVNTRIFSFHGFYII